MRLFEQTLILAGGLLATAAVAASPDVSPATQEARRPGPKRIVVCMDGTWNHPARPSERDDGDQVFKPTNVLKTCRAVKDVDDATATLVLSGQPLDGETVTIDGKTYTFQDQLTPGDGHVQIAEETKESVKNLLFAITTKRTTKQRYGTGTTPHPAVETRAVKGNPRSFELTARTDAAGGDPFAVSTTLTHGTWVDKSKIAAEARDRGLDPGLGIPQIAFYDVGVGGVRKYPGFSNSVHRTVDKLFGGAAGAGFEGNVEDAYTFLAHNYVPGDEIFIFGFSRGASTARGLSRFIDWMGGILPSTDAYWIPRYFDDFLAGDAFEVIQGTVQPARVKFLGVWDTVLAISKKRARPHVGTTPAAIVDHARQAVAIDERRANFLPRIWEGRSDDNREQTLEQRWFAGVHSNIGGGYVNDGLANVALEWMLKEAQAAGLGIDWEFLSPYLPGYPQDQIYDSSTLFWRFAQTVTLRNKKGIRQLETSEAAGLTFHPSVFQRLASVKDEPGGRPHPKLVPYRPKNLLRFLAGLPDLDALLDAIPGLGEDFVLPEEVREAIRKAR